MMDDLERQLLAAGRREPAADVRERVLAATMPLVRAHRSRVDRMWFSLKWRTAAALGVLALAGADVFSTHLLAWAVVPQDGRVSERVKAVEMAARETGLAPADVAALVAQAIAAATASRTRSADVADEFVQRSNR